MDYERGLCGTSERGLGWACTPPNAVLWLVGLWLISFPAKAVAMRMTDCTQSPETVIKHRRNVVTYIVGLVLKSVGFVVTTAMTADFVLGFTSVLHQDTEAWANLFGMINLTMLYLWEMIYRVEMHWTLTIHHLVTIALVTSSCVIAYSFESRLELVGASEVDGMLTLRKTVQRIILVEVLFAMTNQPALVALALHRAGSASASGWFKLAAIWEATSKNLRLVAIVPLYIHAWEEEADRVCDSECNTLRLVYPWLAVVIWGANMYMVWCLWQLAIRRGHKPGTEDEAKWSQSAHIQMQNPPSTKFEATGKYVVAKDLRRTYLP